MNSFKQNLIIKAFFKNFAQPNIIKLKPRYYFNFKYFSSAGNTKSLNKNDVKQKPLRKGDYGPYIGAKTKFTDQFSFDVKNNNSQGQKTFHMPTYRVIDEMGELINKDYSVKISDKTLIKMYESMVQISVMDKIFYEAQRQGRISFYMTCTGEEAIHIGSAEPLTLDDVIYMQYREAGVLIQRGFGLQQMADQCFSNIDDLGKGKQMPVHYGSQKLNVHTVSSPLATQIPQASGAAYALKLAGKKAVSVCYFGDGAASEGDFHSALNFASTLNCPVIFICRNNGWAISTPIQDQQHCDAADGIYGRGIGYGIKSIRVDGNDIFAMNEVVKEARDYAIENNRPVLIEAMTYRCGHHSTSDDSSRYRDDKNLLKYQENFDNPILRLFHFMKNKKIFSEKMNVELYDKTRKQVLKAMANAEVKPKPSIKHIFTEVYDEPTLQLKQQKIELDQHLAKYPAHYKLNEFAQN